MKRIKFLDKEEKELIKSYEKGEWKSVKKEKQKVYVNAAKISKVKSISKKLERWKKILIK